MNAADAQVRYELCYVARSGAHVMEVMADADRVLQKATRLERHGFDVIVYRRTADGTRELIWHETPLEFVEGIRWRYSDGGRAEAGFRGETGDCVTRAIAIATRLPYRQVYTELRWSMQIRAKRLAADGIRVNRTPRLGCPRDIYQPYLEQLGWCWVPTMQIGSGCQVHLRPDELPAGRLIVRLSKHLAAVIDGVLHDNHDSSRSGTRCVYGYFIQEAQA